VGQASRKLKIRINKHKNNINKKSGNLPVIFEYSLQFDHEFDWMNIKILDNEISG